MSERGVVCTEYIYCGECYSVCKEVLYRYGLIGVFPDTKPPIPIIAVRTHNTYSNQEVSMFELTIQPELEKVICHPVRLAIIGETGEILVTVNPK